MAHVADAPKDSFEILFNWLHLAGALIKRRFSYYMFAFLGSLVLLQQMNFFDDSNSDPVPLAANILKYVRDYQSYLAKRHYASPTRQLVAQRGVVP